MLTYFFGTNSVVVLSPNCIVIDGYFHLCLSASQHSEWPEAPPGHLHRACSPRQSGGGIWSRGWRSDPRGQRALLPQDHAQRGHSLSEGEQRPEHCHQEESCESKPPF